MVLSLLAGKTLVALAVFALAAGTMAPGRSSRKARLLLVLGWLALCGIVGFKIMFLHDNVDHARNKSAALIVCVMSATLIFQRGPIGFTLPTIPSPPR